MIDEISRGVEFYRELLRGFREGDLIFDIGANHGQKAAIFLRLGARVIAIDPDEAVDCEQGLVLDKWLTPMEFRGVFSCCTESSLEVFWKTSDPSLSQGSMVG